jgi:hypothetical protein
MYGLAKKVYQFWSKLCGLFFVDHKWSTVYGILKQPKYFQKIRLDNFPLLVSSVEIGNSKKKTNGKVTEVEEPHNETVEGMTAEEIVVTYPQTVETSPQVQVFNGKFLI